uniref:Uncharacterized protein n=1 Tax=Noctiluca scintillans TaxID=2966 RepID=A0A7S1AQZ3_NOCSC|mmetsp:Transcript_56293/g.150482  ORF Transcript_56293/g.150482 Transcript_56293/m.150482 type:complete len:461 (+) Transcript_56293:108-1490(+)|eukprot:CAMPEP_0194502542 /NCGR_PEP_ID=MMETSP0253-20130528/26090_1 /TAXON_ID=2966 /ORGANISM="Noctiluca scintillans" /LENGTH=460 /DNA_ID=CAMNT_0039344705 /DNA_START=106 /DNA_END=1488 /DNA_ORIENTATION=+
MEVRLEAAQPVGPESDTFVALRIGDVQKQSRFGKSKTYRFPDPGDERRFFGRVEVFRRIGTCTVSFDSMDGDLQDVDVRCSDPDFPKLHMKLSVRGSTEGMPEKKSTTKERMKAAQKYVADHHLEELLADAMREVIRNKPDNPKETLSNYILQKTVLPPISPESMKVVLANRPLVPPGERTTLPPVDREIRSVAQDDVAPPVVVDRRPKEDVVEAVKSTPPVTDELSPSKDVVPTPLHLLTAHLPSVATWVSRRPKLMFTELSGGDPTQTCDPSMVSPQTERSLSEDPLTCGLANTVTRGETSPSDEPSTVESTTVPTKERGLLDRVPFKMLPSVGSWSRSLPLLDAALPETEFSKLASVGTWFSCPCVLPPFLEEEEPQLAFFQKPSVAAWLQLVPSTIVKPWYFTEVPGPQSDLIHKFVELVHEREVQMDRLKGDIVDLQRSPRSPQGPTVLSPRSPR